MSAIPPNWLGSIIQSTGAQQRAAEAKDRSAAADAKAAAGPFQHDLLDAIQNTEADSRTDPDAQGAGSQGRAFAEEAPDAELPKPEKPDKTGPSPHLDIEA